MVNGLSFSITPIYVCDEQIRQQSTQLIRSIDSFKSPGHVDVLRILIEHNAEVNAKQVYGRTPIQLAAQNGKCIKFQTQTIFQFCSVYNLGHVDVVRILIEKKAEIESRSNMGWTTLHIAANDGNCL